MQRSYSSFQAGIFKPEDRVRVKTGALIEKEAVMVENQGNHTLLFLVNFGIQVKVDLRQNLLEKI